jgi:hypothetical protein
MPDKGEILERAFAPTGRRLLICELELARASGTSDCPIVATSCRWLAIAERQSRSAVGIADSVLRRRRERAADIAERIR